MEKKQINISKYLPINYLNSLGNPEKPHKDWSILLGTSLVIALILSLFNAFVFISINTGTLFSVAPPEGTSVGTVNRTELNETLAIYNERKDKFDDLLEGSSGVSDPSL